MKNTGPSSPLSCQRYQHKSSRYIQNIWPSSWGLCHFQVIICTKEVSVGARKSAYNLLVEIGNAFVRFCGNTKGNICLFWRETNSFISFVKWLRNGNPPTCCVCDPEAMEQYLALVYAGFTGSVTMITCTVLALTRLVFEYKGRSPDLPLVLGTPWSGSCSSGAIFCLPDAIEVSTMEQLLHNICVLLSSRTREIVKAALGFIKVILFIMDPKTLATHVTVMVGIGCVGKSGVKRSGTCAVT